MWVLKRVGFERGLFPGGAPAPPDPPDLSLRDFPGEGNFHFIGISHINGDFPPNSKVNFFPVPAVSFFISLPTSVDPVKAIFDIPFCFTKCDPVIPSPVTTFTTPAGNLILLHISAKYSAVREVCSAGLSITELPAAILVLLSMLTLVRGNSME